ncbi:MAG: hypothetical protein U0746_19510 [Gemmataceae bacterium]
MAPTRVRWRCLRRAALALLVVAGLWAVVVQHFRRLDRQAWTDACAEADRLDPGWRWDEMARPAVPRRSVGVDQIAAAAKVLKARKPANGAEVHTAIEKVPLLRRLAPELVAQLRAATAPDPALTAVEALADLPAAPLPWPNSPVLIDHQSNPVGADPLDYVRLGKDFLYLQLVLRCDDSDMDAALGSIRALNAASRPPAEYPNGDMYNLIAGAIQAYAARGVERMLAQSELSPATLDAIRRLFEAEGKRNLLLPYYRGKRATIEDTIRAVDEGRLPRAEVAQWGLFADPPPTSWPTLNSWLQGVTSADFKRSNATVMLRGYTWLVERLKESPDAMPSHVSEWKTRLAQMPQSLFLDGRLALEMFREINEYTALVRCAAVAVAAEQFRRERGHWPAALDELVPRYLAAVPADPFDLAPLRLVRRPDGIVIYSIGPNGKDDGGAVAGDGVPRPTDHGVRLWDVAQRRQPPASRTRP